MRRHSPDSDIPGAARGASLALGNFDGVHRGHQAVVAAAREAARAKGVKLAAGVFAPHPRRFFQPDAPPFRLQSDTQRARALAGLGVEELFEIGFDASLSRLSDEDFARTVLHERLGVVHVAVGADFRFGRGRMGDAESLARLGRAFGFSVSAAAAVADAQGARVSSTAIRAAIAAGDMGKASALLTRPFAIEGAVQRGFGRGRDFGFATANLALGDYARPRLGIYAVRALVHGSSFDGVASVGVNPTVGALPEPLLEAHLFGLDRDLYGAQIEVALIAFLRDEARFDDIEALKAQMARDAADAKAALRSPP